MPRRAAKNIREVAATVFDLATGRYPGFVYGAGLTTGLIPVFCFHGAEAGLFEQQLKFLCENGYVTLTADEYLSIILGKSPAPRKAVMLTFDDGWGSLWSVGYTLLKRYGLKITVFLAADRVEYRTRYYPNVGDLEAGKCSADAVFDRDKAEQALLTWEEVEEMHESGLVDFQSHSYSHSLVFRSPRIVDFVHPDLLGSYSFLELPNPGHEWRSGARAPVRLGEPLYQTAPRLSDTRRFLPDPRTGEACASLVEQEGPGFFRRPRWRSKLLRLIREQVGDLAGEPLYETDRERAEAIWFELAESRRVIEEHLPGKQVRHICYPWHAAGTLAVRLSREAGYVSNFLGRVDGRYCSRGRVDPFRIARVSGDFLFRLPGEGRVGLARILAHKLRRRLRHGSPYLTH